MMRTHERHTTCPQAHEQLFVGGLRVEHRRLRGGADHNDNKQRKTNHRKGKTTPTPSTHPSPTSHCSWGGSQVLDKGQNSRRRTRTNRRAEGVRVRQKRRDDGERMRWHLPQPYEPLLVGWDAGVTSRGRG
jgi:hypothetical protein